MRNFLGKDGFVWWIGIVEDTDDPLELGRCRVRCIGYHPQLKRPKANSIDQQVSTEDLPWAVAIHPTNLSNFYGIPKLGDWVLGFFLDANSAQEPAILGIIPSNPTLLTTYKEYFGEYPRFVPAFSKVENDETTENTVIFNTIHNYVDATTKALIAIPEEGDDLTEVQLAETKNKIDIAEKTNDKTFGIIHPTGTQIQIKEYQTTELDDVHEFLIKEKNGSNLTFKESIKTSGDTEDSITLEHSNGNKIELKNNLESGILNTSITIEHETGTKISIDRLGNLTITGIKNTTINTTDDLIVTAKNISLTATQSLTIADSGASHTPTSIKSKNDAQDTQIEVAKTLPALP